MTKQQAIFYSNYYKDYDRLFVDSNIVYSIDSSSAKSKDFYFVHDVSFEGGLKSFNIFLPKRFKDYIFKFDLGVKLYINNEHVETGFLIDQKDSQLKGSGFFSKLDKVKIDKIDVTGKIVDILDYLKELCLKLDIKFNDVIDIDDIFIDIGVLENVALSELLKKLMLELNKDGLKYRMFFDKKLAFNFINIKNDFLNSLDGTEKIFYANKKYVKTIFEGSHIFNSKHTTSVDGLVTESSAYDFYFKEKSYANKQTVKNKYLIKNNGRYLSTLFFDANNNDITEQEKKDLLAEQLTEQITIDNKLTCISPHSNYKKFLFNYYKIAIDSVDTIILINELLSVNYWYYSAGTDIALNDQENRVDFILDHDSYHANANTFFIFDSPLTNINKLFFDYSATHDLKIILTDNLNNSYTAVLKATGGSEIFFRYEIYIAYKQAEEELIVSEDILKLNDDDFRISSIQKDGNTTNIRNIKSIKFVFANEGEKLLLSLKNIKGNFKLPRKYLLPLYSLKYEKDSLKLQFAEKSLIFKDTLKNFVKEITKE